MKKLKVNLVAVLVLTMAITTLSFNLYNKEAQDLRWFPVETSTGAIASTSNPTGNCLVNLTTNVCAVRLAEDHDYTNISGIPEDEAGLQWAGRP